MRPNVVALGSLQLRLWIVSLMPLPYTRLLAGLRFGSLDSGSGLKFEVQGRLGPVRGLGVLGPRNWLEHFKHTVGFGLLGSGVFV